MLVSSAQMRGWVGGGGGRNPFWAMATCPGLLRPLARPDAATLHGLYSGEGQPGHGDRAG